MNLQITKSCAKYDDELIDEFHQGPHCVRLFAAQMCTIFVPANNLVSYLYNQLHAVIIDME